MNRCLTGGVIARFLLLSMGLLFGGCALNRPPAATTPIVFVAPPDAGQLVATINAHSSRVQQLHAEQVRLSVPGQLGSVRATLDYVAPQQIRLSGESIRGPELDLGSNAQRYWVWVRENQPPTVFYGEQQTFGQSATQQLLPMPPDRIFSSALGLVHLDPGQNNEVYSSAPGQLQIRSPVVTPQGNLLRILEVDAQRALITRQLLYGPSNQLLASVDASEFTYLPAAQVSLPRRLQISLPGAGLQFQLETDTYLVNVPASDPERFKMPNIPNHRYLNLGNPQDMQGILMLGSGATADPYDNRAARREVPQAAWRRFLPGNLLRR